MPDPMAGLPMSRHFSLSMRMYAHIAVTAFADTLSDCGRVTEKCRWVFTEGQERLSYIR